MKKHCYTTPVLEVVMHDVTDCMTASIQTEDLGFGDWGVKDEF